MPGGNFWVSRVKNMALNETIPHQGVIMRNKHIYTCPDVIHYRRNQYRLAVWSNIFSIGYMALFFGALSYVSKSKTPPVPTTATPDLKD